MPAPYAIEVTDFKPGQHVRLMYNARDISPQVGTVVRIDTACNKVDVEFPMGAERCAPEMLVKVDSLVADNEDILPDPVKHVQSRVVHAAALKMHEIEEAASTLLHAGYSEDETINILADSLEKQSSRFTVSNAVHRSAFVNQDSIHSFRTAFKEKNSNCPECGSNMMRNASKHNPDGLICPSCLLIQEF